MLLLHRFSYLPHLACLSGKAAESQVKAPPRPLKHRRCKYDLREGQPKAIGCFVLRGTEKKLGFCPAFSVGSGLVVVGSSLAENWQRMKL